MNIWSVPRCAPLLHTPNVLALLLNVAALIAALRSIGHYDAVGPGSVLINVESSGFGNRRFCVMA